MFNPIILSGVFLGWGLGANDSANVFGTAVYTKVVKYSTAIIITSIFVVLGAYVDGHRGIEKLSNYAFQGGIDTPSKAFFVMLAAALTVAFMTVMKLPVSTSQAVIGAIIGGGLLSGKADFSSTTQFFGAWILTPIGAMVIAFILYKIISDYFGLKLSSFRFYEVFIRLGYLSAGILGSYSLGANNVANVTAVFSGPLNILGVKAAAIIGGLSIMLGVLTYSKPVMSTIGEKIISLSPIAGFVVALAAALTVYIYALIGIPVSTSQAIVGAIIGIGLKTGIRSLNFKLLKNIFLGWFLTPTAALIVSLVFSFLIVG